MDSFTSEDTSNLGAGGFYKSICGTKKIINMPESGDISAFCEKVRNGDISVEYESHYVEFDDYGHFHDDWEHDFYDPKQAMSFISSVIRGCHDLIVLEEYENAFRILDDIIGPKCAIIDHPDTDDTCEDEYMDLDMAAHEGILSIDRDDLLRDYIESCRCSIKDSSIAAEKIVSALEMKIFEDNAQYVRMALVAYNAVFADMGDISKPEYLIRIVENAITRGSRKQ